MLEAGIAMRLCGLAWLNRDYLNYLLHSDVGLSQTFQQKSVQHVVEDRCLQQLKVFLHLCPGHTNWENEKRLKGYLQEAVCNRNRDSM